MVIHRLLTHFAVLRRRECVVLEVHHLIELEYSVKRKSGRLRKNWIDIIKKMEGNWPETRDVWPSVIWKPRNRDHVNSFITYSKTHAIHKRLADLELQIHVLRHFLTVWLEQFDGVLQRVKHLISGCRSVFHSHHVTHYLHQTGVIAFFDRLI